MDEGDNPCTCQNHAPWFVFARDEIAHRLSRRRILLDGASRYAVCLTVSDPSRVNCRRFPGAFADTLGALVHIARTSAEPDLPNL